MTYFNYGDPRRPQPAWTLANFDYSLARVKNERQHPLMAEIVWCFDKDDYGQVNKEQLNYFASGPKFVVFLDKNGKDSS